LTSKQTKTKHDAKSDKPKGKNVGQLDEYMQVMKPRTKNGPSWANEAHSQPQSDVTSPIVHPSRAKLVENAEVAEEEQEKEDDEDLSAEREEGISDLDWMKRRMTQNIDGTDKAFEQSEDEMDHTSDAEEPSREVSILLLFSSVA
jgi:multiple RNA-binding domain-containing protein 1